MYCFVAKDDKTLYYMVMAEQQDVGTDIERSTPDVGKTKDLQPQTEMDLEKARTILQAIVDTDEAKLTAKTLDVIGGHSVDEIRQAEKVVATSIMDRFEGKDTSNGLLVDKHLRNAKVSLYLQPHNVEINYFGHDDTLISMCFPLKEPENDSQKKLSYFVENYPGEPQRKTSMLRVSQAEDPLPGMRHMLRGLRFLSINMLHWEDPTVIMPNDLGKVPPKSLPASPSAIQ